MLGNYRDRRIWMRKVTVSKETSRKAEQQY